MVLTWEYEYEIIGEISKGTLNLYTRFSSSYNYLIFMTRAPVDGNLEKAVEKAVTFLHENVIHEGVEYTAINFQGKYPEIKGKLPDHHHCREVEYLDMFEIC